MNIVMLKNVFTRETANVFQAEVIECPNCAFEFSVIHEQSGSIGTYVCPCCEIGELERMMYHLRLENQKLKQLLLKEREDGKFWP